MLKNIMAFRIVSEATKEMLLHSDDLVEAMNENQIIDPHKTSWRRYGFAHPERFGEQILFEGSLGCRMMCVEVRERILPGDVIRRETEKRVHEMEEKEGRNAHRKDWAVFKDDIVAKLLPQAFIKAKQIMILIKGNWLLVDSGSAKTSEDVISFLRESFGELGPMNLRPLIGENINKWLRDIALGDFEGATLDDFAQFRHLDSAVLKADGTIRLKDVPFSTDEAQKAIINSKAVKELSVEYGFEDGKTDLHFSLTDSLAIKRIKYSDIITAQAREDSDQEDIVSHFDATMAIVSDILVKLVDSINANTGGPEIFDSVIEDEKSGFELGDSNLETDFQAITDTLGEALQKFNETGMRIIDPELEDSFFRDAVEFVSSTGSASISRIQRKFRIGYNRAARLVEVMEQKGILSTGDAEGYRDVDLNVAQMYLTPPKKQKTLAEMAAEFDDEDDDEL